MKTVKTIPPKIRENDKNALVIRLERTQKDLIQLRSQLDSYRCEPRTYGLFEYIENLKKGMDKLNSTNLEIIDKLRTPRDTVSNPVEKAKQQFSKFNELQDKVAHYRAQCKEH